MKKHIAIIAAVGIMGLCGSSYGRATEQIGPDSARPTFAQPSWPKGIVGIPRHMSRVYSIWVNGNESFYFKCTVDEINELLALFAKARLRDHVVRIEPGPGKVNTFREEEIEYNVRLQIVAGIALAFARERGGEGLPLEPKLTILTGDDGGAFVRKLKWPKSFIVESEIEGVSINPDRTRPKRDFYDGLCEFEDGSAPVEFVRSVRSTVTLWEQAEPNGIAIGRIDNKGYCRLLLSDGELADLKKGKTWLTVTIANWLANPAKTDMRFPVEMLTREKDKAQPVKVAPPSYYYGRLLFEDGTPTILDPPPWPGAEIDIDFPYAGPASFDSEGYFKVPLTKEQFDKLSARKPRRNIYIPDLVKKGRASAKFIFPPNLLSPDKATAGVVKIPRPKLPKKDLATAESKIGKPVPGFDTIRFGTFETEQTKGRQLLVCFWDMDQRPSRQCIRVLQEQSGTSRDKNTVVLVVNAGAKRGKEAEDWLKENGPSLTAGIVKGDPHDTLLAWGARGLPWLVLTDKEHVITKAGFNLGALEQTEGKAERAKESQ